MQTLKQVSVEQRLVTEIPNITEMEEQLIYISLEYKTASHLCLCGCKNLTVTPLGIGWWTIFIERGKINIQPSIGNFQFDCKSHYIIKNGIANFV